MPDAVAVLFPDALPDSSDIVLGLAASPSTSDELSRTGLGAPWVDYRYRGGGRSAHIVGARPFFRDPAIQTGNFFAPPRAPLFRSPSVYNPITDGRYLGLSGLGADPYSSIIGAIAGAVGSVASATPGIITAAQPKLVRETAQLQAQTAQVQAASAASQKASEADALKALAYAAAGTAAAVTVGTALYYAWKKRRRR